MFDYEKAKLVITKHSIAKKMRKERIFCFEIDKKEILIWDACDECFSLELNNDICVQISNLFSCLAECFSEE